jgi:hypothetical protein
MVSVKPNMLLPLGGRNEEWVQGREGELGRFWSFLGESPKASKDLAVRARDLWTKLSRSDKITISVAKPTRRVSKVKTTVQITVF